MADNSAEKPDAAAPVASAEQVSASGSKAAAEGELAAKTVNKSDGDAAMEEAKDAQEPKASESAEDAAEAASSKPAEDEKKTDADGDAEMKDAADTAAEPEADTPAVKGKNRRKSTAGESKGKTLSKKGSKARLTHIDAQPGDHFLVKLKGFPAWPAIICDEDMLPQALINTRPVSAARPDGSYSEAYADGGKRVHDRSFPVMYLYTNEFGWVANTALSELTAEKARDTIGDKMRKDLKAAFELAIEQNSVEHYKEILQSFQDELIAQEEARKEAAATPKKPKKGKAKASDEDEDVDMEDVDEAPKSKPKKRKATDEDTNNYGQVPQRSESVKKPKIKLNTSSSSKAANGTAAPKAKEEKVAKVAKTAKAKPKKGVDKKSDAPKEAKLTPEERRARKEKEVLYLRHKLQRGLLTREQQPREDEMDSMSSFITILENFHDLEVSIIRGTKINKVLKAILKLDSIPREEDFNFKKRSQALLDKWNKLLASDGTIAPAGTANGVNGASESKDSGKPTGNSGVKEGGDKDKEAEDEKAKGDAEGAVATATTKDEEPKSKEDAPVSAAVEAAA
ncbi:hypothetical protein Trco_006423 [Trichoderma cornu-damae]|uniref:PWWP domain-containing protein n=1 Tax=Trichoderma cornu-damae TaxID=654480 RepID=A0A9P8TRU0_9HYPO|nr:hypothetical protein Trco_006423 [Trichoderma cornu-damae]